MRGSFEVNRLSSEKRSHVLQLLCEGNSSATTAQLSGVGVRTIAKLLVTAGQACMAYQDRSLVDLKCNRLDVRKPWTFAATRQENIPEADKGTGAHRCSTWVASDTRSNLVVHWYVGDEGADVAIYFMRALAGRMSHRIGLTIDTAAPYLTGIEGARGVDIDYAILSKAYESMGGEERKRIHQGGTEYFEPIGEEGLDPKHICAGHLGHNDAIMRRHCKPYAPLTPAFTKTIENHVYAFALHTLYHNFLKIAQVHQMSPAMMAGIEARLWEVDDIVKLVEEWEASNQS
jgi:hypothetical protein